MQGLKALSEYIALRKTYMSNFHSPSDMLNLVVDYVY